MVTNLSINYKLNEILKSDNKNIHILLEKETRSDKVDGKKISINICRVASLLELYINVSNVKNNIYLYLKLFIQYALKEIAVNTKAIKTLQAFKKHSFSITRICS